MSIFLTKIHINKIFHLENIDIDVNPTQKRHLIITGKNGCGKTSLLNALVDYLQLVKSDSNLSFLGIENQLKNNEQYLINAIDLKSQNDIRRIESQVTRLRKLNDEISGRVVPVFSDIEQLSTQIEAGEFLLAFYEANRKTKVQALINPVKPNLTPQPEIKANKVGEFLKFLVDLKIQEALARNENAVDDANNIKEWFENFRQLLGELFEGENVQLEFNYKDYSFQIIQGNRVFGFNELSDGYSAIIDIIADLIIKMQNPNSLTRAYEKEGIVLIDEIETHLHLELQKAILPMLTRVFPNIQFIVTTHSPFVLNSLKDAVAFDLEKKKRLDDLTDYSYEALAEGYFGVSSDSSYLQVRLNRFKKLITTTNRDSAENIELSELENELDSLNEAFTSPNFIGEYLHLKMKKK